MMIQTLDSKSIYLLNEFIKNPLSGQFRYFQKRDLTCVKNHLVTLIGLINNKPIAYGHIDYSSDENKYWLGVCVLNDYQGKSYGKQIMDELIIQAMLNNLKEINLSVDKNNTIAINLYQKYEFSIIEEHNSYYLMKKVLSQ